MSCVYIQAYPLGIVSDDIISLQRLFSQVNY